jgi:hypothetical protein
VEALYLLVQGKDYEPPDRTNSSAQVLQQVIKYASARTAKTPDQIMDRVEVVTSEGKIKEIILPISISATIDNNVTWTTLTDNGEYKSWPISLTTKHRFIKEFKKKGEYLQNDKLDNLIMKNAMPVAMEAGKDRTVYVDRLFEHVLSHKCGSYPKKASRSPSQKKYYISWDANMHEVIYRSCMMHERCKKLREDYRLPSGNVTFGAFWPNESDETDLYSALRRCNMQTMSWANIQQLIADTRSFDAVSTISLSYENETKWTIDQEKTKSQFNTGLQLLDSADPQKTYLDAYTALEKYTMMRNYVRLIERRDRLIAWSAEFAGIEASLQKAKDRYDRLHANAPPNYMMASLLPSPPETSEKLVTPKELDEAKQLLKKLEGDKNAFNKSEQSRNADWMREKGQIETQIAGLKANIKKDVPEDAISDTPERLSRFKTIIMVWRRALWEEQIQKLKECINVNDMSKCASYMINMLCVHPDIHVNDADQKKRIMRIAMRIHADAVGLLRRRHEPDMKMLHDFLDHAAADITFTGGMIAKAFVGAHTLQDTDLKAFRHEFWLARACPDAELKYDLLSIDACRAYHEITVSDSARAALRQMLIQALRKPKISHCICIASENDMTHDKKDGKYICLVNHDPVLHHEISIMAEEHNHQWAAKLKDHYYILLGPLQDTVKGRRLGPRTPDKTVALAPLVIGGLRDAYVNSVREEYASHSRSDQLHRALRGPVSRIEIEYVLRHAPYSHSIVV